MSSILGMCVFALGGLAGATFLLPARGVKGWAYETWWLVYVFVGHICCPTLICALMVPDFWAVVTSAPAPVLAKCVLFGALWGVGGLTWGLMVRYLGIGLGLGIGAGLCAATGTLLPPVCTGHAADLVATPGARVVLAGVGVSLAGIVAVGLAGRFKECEMSAVAKRQAVAEFDFRKGLVAAIVAGVASAGINFGLQGAPELERAALASGTSPTWAGMPVLTVVLWGGLLTQLVWVGWKRWCACANGHVDFKSLSSFRPLTSEVRAALRNFILSGLVGILGALQFVLQKAGEPLMGDFRYISFAVLMSSAVFFSAILGVCLGEWRGPSARTKAFLAVGIAVLALGFAVMAVGGK